MTHSIRAIPLAFVLCAGFAFAGEDEPAAVNVAPDTPGFLRVLEAPSPGPGAWDLTRITFSLQGPYSGAVEFYQVEDLKYRLRVQHGTASRAEYEVALPSPLDEISYKVATSAVTRETEAQLMEYMRAHTYGPVDIFGALAPGRSVKLKAILIAALYVVCVSQLLRLRPAGRRVIAVSIATVAFCVAELLLVAGRVEESSVVLYEGRTGRGVCSYELIGLGAPWGGRAEVRREKGILYPVYRDKRDLWRNKLDIELAGEGSFIEGVKMERGRWRTFCCVSPARLAGGLELRDGLVLNATGLDMRGYLFTAGRLLDLGHLSDGGRADAKGVSAVSKSELLSEAQKCLVPPAVALLAWRTRHLVAGDTVIGLVPPSRLIFFETAGDAGTD